MYSPERLSGFPPGSFPSVLLFFCLALVLLSCVSDSTRPFRDPISSVLSRFPLSRFPFRRVRLYQKFLAGLTGCSFLRFIGMWSSRIQVLEKPVDFHCRHRTCPALGNCSNLPPHSLRVNGVCGAKRRLAARQLCPHIRRQWGPTRCARPPRGRPSRRRAPLAHRGRTRTRGRPVQRRHRS